MRAGARRLVYGLRTEGAGAGREAAAVGIGIFIGCLPFYGFHLLLCWAIGWLLGLNRLKVYIAANISNPFFAPILLFSEVQLGGLVRRGSFHPLTVQAVSTTDLSVFGLDLLMGSVVLGTTLGAALAGLTFLSMRGSADDERFAQLVRDASERYVTASLTTWEFARAKLRSDPLYRAVICGGRLPSGGTLIDIGCGSGPSLALLAEAEAWLQRGLWPDVWGTPPVFDRLVGIESRTRVARLAQRALGTDATIVCGDARTTPFEPCRVVLLFDVLHMIPAGDQEALLSKIAASLEPGGVLLIREADAAGGWRFTVVRLGNRAKALAFGHWGQRFHFRSSDQWVACLARAGFSARVRPMHAGTPFANVLFEATRTRPLEP